MSLSPAPSNSGSIKQEPLGTLITAVQFMALVASNPHELGLVSDGIRRPDHQIERIVNEEELIAEVRKQFVRTLLELAEPVSLSDFIRRVARKMNVKGIVNTSDAQHLFDNQKLQDSYQKMIEKVRLRIAECHFCAALVALVVESPESIGARKTQQGWRMDCQERGSSMMDAIVYAAAADRPRSGQELDGAVGAGAKAEGAAKTRQGRATRECMEIRRISILLSFGRMTDEEQQRITEKRLVELILADLESRQHGAEGVPTLYQIRKVVNSIRKDRTALFQRQATDMHAELTMK